MNKSFLFALALACATGANAQKGITSQVLTQLQGSYTGTPQERAMRNAISSTSLRKMALNQAHAQHAQHTQPTSFSVEVANTGISDQQSSGRCWLFTGTNVLRQRAMKKLGVDNFFFSQVYLFFYDQLEKSNLFLQGIIDTRQQAIDSEMVRWLFKNPLSDGGTYTGVADLVTKYGLVPQDVMAETWVSNNTSEFASHLKRKLRECGITLRQRAQEGASQSQLEALKAEQLQTVYRLLVMAYGDPPRKFTWAPRKNGKPVGEAKTYTPQEFYTQVCAEGEDLNADYVMLMNDPSRPYGKVYEIDYDRHVYDGHNWLYLNLPIHELKHIAIASLKDSTQMYFSCDVGKCLNRDNGTLDLDNYDYDALLGTTFGMDKRQRIQTFDSGSSHAMTLMAVDLDPKGTPLKWKVENSWGATSGQKGYLVMTDRWFEEYMFRIVAHRKYIPADVLQMLQQEPIRLPAWDPMFAHEE